VVLSVVGRLAQDFKEAGRLAEQAKASAGQAEKSTARAAELRAAAAGVGQEESAAAARLEDLEAQLSSAVRASGLALWRSLQVCPWFKSWVGH
jgi:hypothetical protein